MTGSSLAQQQLEPADLRFLRATLHNPSRESTSLLISELSLGSAFVISTRPPPLFSRISLQIHAPGGCPLPALEAWVAGLQSDPDDQSKCGFELLFVDPDDEALDRIAWLVVDSDQWEQ